MSSGARWVGPRDPRSCRSEEHKSLVGAWRSLVAHLHGVQGVPSSNLGAPTTKKSVRRIECGQGCGQFSETPTSSDSHESPHGRAKSRSSGSSHRQSRC